jgi:hypothetical protein
MPVDKIKNFPNLVHFFLAVCLPLLLLTVTKRYAHETEWNRVIVLHCLRLTVSGKPIQKLQDIGVRGIPPRQFLIMDFGRVCGNSIGSLNELIVQIPTEIHEQNSNFLWVERIANIVSCLPPILVCFGILTAVLGKQTHGPW